MRHVDSGVCWCQPHCEIVYVNPDNADDRRVSHMVIIHNDLAGIVLGTFPRHYRFSGCIEVN